jgi:hypothetical protein
VKAFDFESNLSDDRTLTIPTEVAVQLQPQQTVRVLLLVPEAEEAAAWEALTTAQFLRGYADSDAIYDNLSAG